MRAMPAIDDDKGERAISVDDAVCLRDGETECAPELGLTDPQLQILKIAGCEVADFLAEHCRHPTRSYDYARLRGEGIKHGQAMAVLSSQVPVSWYLAHKHRDENMTALLGQRDASDGLAFRLGIAPEDDRLFPQFTTVGASRSTPNLLWPDGEISVELPTELRPDADVTDAMLSHWSDQLCEYAPRGSNRPRGDPRTYINGLRRLAVAA